MMWATPASLPSRCTQLLLFRGGPTEVPPASDPWQPLQVPSLASPWKIRFPRATSAGVAPGGVGSGRGLRPASGGMPSGGTADVDASAATIAARAPATLSDPSPL